MLRNMALYVNLAALLLLSCVVLLLCEDTLAQDYTCSNDTLTCDPENCTLPNCRCWSYDTPGDLNTTEIPQMVLFTFMNSYGKFFYDRFSSIFRKSRRNPNGASISATLYVTDQDTDYCAVRKLWEAGHEVASHGLSYSGYPKVWQAYNETEWWIHMANQRYNISNETGIDETEIRGLRTPYFESGGDKMFTMLADAGFTYDSTLKFQGADQYGNQVWPFTLDFPPTFPDSLSQPLPTQCYKGIWEVPLRYLEATDNTTECSPLEDCQILLELLDDEKPTKEDTIRLLKKNFDAYYETNKAPIMFSITTEWLNRSYILMQALNEFLEEILSYDDVYVVTTWQAIQWIQNPTPLQDLNAFEPWKPKQRPKEDCYFKQKFEETGVIQATSGEDGILDSMFSGNGLVAIEIIFLFVCAALLIIKDNTGG